MSEINIELVKPIQFGNETFTIDEGEKALLNGTYSIKRHVNPHPNLEKIFDEFWSNERLFHSKSIFMLGNILYKVDEPHIEDMIDLIIRCTYADKLPDFVDASVKEKKQMRAGTICPTKEVIFRHEGKLYILYGRYIYGYDKHFVNFLNDNIEGDEDLDEGDEDLDDGDEDLDDGDEDLDDADEDLDDGDEDLDEGDENLDDDDEYEDYEDISDNEETERDALLSREEIVVPRVTGFHKDVPMNDYVYAFSIIDEKTGVLSAFAIYH